MQVLPNAYLPLLFDEDEDVEIKSPNMMANKELAEAVLHKSSSNLNTKFSNLVVLIQGSVDNTNISFIISKETPQMTH